MEIKDLIIDYSRYLVKNGLISDHEKMVIAREKYIEKLAKKEKDIINIMELIEGRGEPTIKVVVDNKKGYTTSIIPFSTGDYPIWFDGSDKVKFVSKSEVLFE